MYSQNDTSESKKKRTRNNIIDGWGVESEGQKSNAISHNHNDNKDQNFVLEH